MLCKEEQRSERFEAVSTTDATWRYTVQHPKSHKNLVLVAATGL